MIFHFKTLARHGLVAIATTLAVGLSAGKVLSADNEPTRVLFMNVNVFDGRSDSLLSHANVLVEGNLIKAIGPDVRAENGTTVINGAGRTLMPGLIDIHSHLCVQNGLPWGRDNWDQMAMGAMTGDLLKDFLQQGFTTTRDAGCNTLGMAKAVRLGRIDGPRIYSSGGWLSQTGGHADLGSWNDPLHGAVDDLQRAGQNHVVDGVPEVIKATRHNFRGGATQIKIMASGGVSSEFDPIHMTQFSLEEMKAIVATAEDYGSYVMAHAYHDNSVNRALDAGVKVIEQPGTGCGSESYRARLSHYRAHRKADGEGRGLLVLAGRDELHSFCQARGNHLLHGGTTGQGPRHVCRCNPGLQADAKAPGENRHRR
jgi:imidazolonepropionase-like amidohydrolase